MIKKSTANLPLHGGKAPAWLFSRMKKLAREMLLLIIKEYGPDEVLKRLSDPVWFQAFGCVLGFDWHSSGLTTTVNAAVKQAFSGLEKETGFFAAGGKGGRSRKTPFEIERYAGTLNRDLSFLVRTSRLAAKVDSAAIQDGYRLYLHHIFFTKNGKWAVVQQGMNTSSRYARRYHWISEKAVDFTNEPHSGIAGQRKEKSALNMTAKKSAGARGAALEFSKIDPAKALKEVKIIREITLPARHEIIKGDIFPRNFEKTLISAYEAQAKSFEDLLLVKGLGPKTLRALALIAELVYKREVSYDDPVAYSFAHGGKDGTPFPVDRKVYDSNINFLRELVGSSKAGYSEKNRIFKRLSRFSQEGSGGETVKKP